MDNIEARLKSLLEEAKTNCSTDVEEKDLALGQLASLQDELANMKTRVEEATTWVEIVEEGADESRERYCTEGNVEGEKGKEEAVLAAVDDFLNSEGFITKRKEVVVEFMTS